MLPDPSPHGFDIDQVEAAAADLAATGQTIIRGALAPDDLELARTAVRQACSTVRKVDLGAGNETYQRAFDQYLNLWQVDPSVEVITLHPGLGQLAAQLLGVEQVRLYHDQALTKIAGGGPTPWHQDHWYWPLETDRMLTMWLPLVDVSAEMGELEFALGTHRGPIGDEAISADSQQFYERFLAEHPAKRRRTGSMKAGDASFHLSWTLHRAEPNASLIDREVMTVIWFADGTVIAEPTTTGQRFDLAIWLPGQSPGDVAGSPVNPVVGRA